MPNLEEIAKRRNALDITQNELGRRANTSRSTIGKLERNLVKDPSYHIVKRIFDTLESLEKERMIGLKSYSINQIHNTPIEFVDVSETVNAVWERMEKTCFSQFPVKDGDNIVGSITERGINNSIMLGRTEKLKFLPVSEIMEDLFPTVSVNMQVAGVISLLQNVQAVLTFKGNNVIGIVTNTDIGKIFGLQ